MGIGITALSRSLGSLALGEASHCAGRPRQRPCGEAHEVKDRGPFPNHRHQFASRVSKQAEPPAPVKPSEDRSPAQHPDRNFTRNPKPELPSQAAARFLTLTTRRKYVCYFKPLSSEITYYRELEI